jgi:putative Mn2+ efflux pump MntP
MILESMRTGVENTKTDLLNPHVLLILSIATSIDALVVGTSLSLLRIPIVIPAIVIGIVTFLLSFLAVSVGNRVGQFFGNKIKIIAVSF